MKKKTIILSILIMVCVVTIISVIICLNNNKKKYGIIEIVMGIATATDRSLEYEIEDENVIKFDHKETKSNAKKDEVGGTKKEQYYFVGINEGSTKVTFIKKDIGGEISGEYEYEVTVDKNLNVKVKKGVAIKGIFIPESDEVV